MDLNMNFDAIKPLIFPILVSVARHILTAVGYDATDNQEVVMQVAGWLSTAVGLVWVVLDKVKIQKLKEQVAENATSSKEATVDSPK